MLYDTLGSLFKSRLIKRSGSNRNVWSEFRNGVCVCVICEPTRRFLMCENCQRNESVTFVPGFSMYYLRGWRF